MVFHTSAAIESIVGPPAPEVWNTITSHPAASSASRIWRVPASVVPSVPIRTSGLSLFGVGW